MRAHNLAVSKWLGRPLVRREEEEGEGEGETEVEGEGEGEGEGKGRGKRERRGDSNCWYTKRPRTGEGCFLLF